MKIRFRLLGFALLILCAALRTHLSAQGSGDCNDPNEPNNTSLTGTWLPLGTNLNGYICTPTDVDWFRIPVTTAGVITVTLTVPVGLNFDLELYGPDLAWKAGSYQGVGKSETVTLGATTGTYYARVYGYPIGNGSHSTTNAYTIIAALVNATRNILKGPITNPANGHKYYLLAENTWQNSEAEAVALGGHLATVRNQAEQNWIFSTFNSFGGTNRSLWIGFNDAGSEGHYTWISGEPVTYTHWLTGQPDNAFGGENYAQMLKSLGGWNDLASPDTATSNRTDIHPISGVAESGGDSPPNSAPTITGQPSSQAANSGGFVIFAVYAVSSSPLMYQWQFTGQNIPNETNATLALNTLTGANDGSYSVVVSNPYGSVTSATASLAVLTDGANGNTPTRITVTPNWSKSSTAKNLVFITHGWQSVEANPLGPPAQPWMAAMTNAIAQRLGGNSAWQLETYDWTWAAWTLEPQQALSQAEYIGTQLGKEIAGMGYQQVHLIAHSAGSGMIQAIANQLQSSSNPPKVQLTFLDPYLGIFLQEKNNYGKNADWSDSYFVEDGSGGFTGGNLDYAFNVDVSWVDPRNTPAPYIGLDGGEVALSSHGYPIDFYLGSMTGGNYSCSSAYGFALSKEVEGLFWINNQVNYPVGSGPFLPCSPLDAVKNPNPGIAGLESGIAGIAAVISDAPHALSSFGANLVGDAGFVLNSIWSALPHVGPGRNNHPLPQGGSVTNGPAWLALGVPVTNAVNFVQFDAGFTDTNAAEGLLTVYWNTNQVGTVDERVASPGLQNYRFPLTATETNGLFTLSFRLDSFANASSVTVTNVATGFVGLTQPIRLAALGIATNGTPVLRLTAPPGYTYLIQASTNLLDWTTTALLVNTNGTALFAEPGPANKTARFYRATVP